MHANDYNYSAQLYKVHKNFCLIIYFNYLPGGGLTENALSQVKLLQ